MIRIIFIAGLLGLVAFFSIVGFRGDASRKPPIELFADMDRQPKVRPQTPSAFFRDGMSSRLPVQGTVARGSHVLDLPINTGLVTGTTNFVATSPMPVDAKLMARGRERYQIYCTPCHGATGEGNGITKSFGMATVASLHDPRLVQMGDGEIFHVISNGRNLMGPYASQIPLEDRWAVVAYVRALQLARLGAPEDLPPGQRVALGR